MKSLVELAASRPFVAWYLGYAPFLAAIGVLVTLQSGWRTAGIVLLVNAVLAAVPVAVLWGTTALRARGGTAWGRERAMGVAAGVAVSGALCALGFWALDEASPPTGFIAALVAIVALANLAPLVLGVGIEAAARRLRDRA